MSASWVGPSWTVTLIQLQAGFGLQLAGAALVAVLAVVAAMTLRHRPDWHGLNPPAACLAAGSVLVIAISTLTPLAGARKEGPVQLIPLHTLSFYWQAHSLSQLLVYVGGNVALFLPLGFFAYLALRGSFGRCVALCAGVSATVEILQLSIWSRTTDVDDVLTNTLGGFLGVLAGYGALRLARRLRTPAAASVSGRAASPWPP